MTETSNLPNKGAVFIHLDSSTSLLHFMPSKLNQPAPTNLTISNQLCKNKNSTQQFTLPENVTKCPHLQEKGTKTQKEWKISFQPFILSRGWNIVAFRVFVSLSVTGFILKGISCHAMSCHKSYRTELVEVSWGNPKKNHDMGISVVEHFRDLSKQAPGVFFLLGAFWNSTKHPFPFNRPRNILPICICIYTYIYVFCKNIYTYTSTVIPLQKPEKKTQWSPFYIHVNFTKPRLRVFATFSHHPHSTAGIPAHRLCHHNSSPSLPRDVGWYTWGNCQRPAGGPQNRVRSKVLEIKKCLSD